MKAHIFCTPEFSNDTIKEVVNLLKSIHGMIEFCHGETMSAGFFALLNPKFKDPDEINSLTFEDFFHLTNGYRESKNIKDEDFVIMISSITNDLNWFSAFKGRDIFVHGGEWDLISNVDSKFELAYQCAENIFQSLIDLKEYHQISIGCVNDFCQNKSEILLKLQTGNICPSCIEMAINKGIDELIVAHIIDILEKVREEFVVSKRFSQTVNLEPVYVDVKGNISIGGLKIKMETLPKTMYITFLKNLQGIKTKEKCKNADLFKEIYSLLRPSHDKYTIQKMCCDKIQYGNSQKEEKNDLTFESNRSKVKGAIKSVVGESLANYYCIKLFKNTPDKGVFRINLKSEKVIISPEFLNRNRNISK